MTHAHSEFDPHSPGPARGTTARAAPAADPAQEALVRALRSSFNILRIIMAVLVVLYVFSGLFRVDPGHQGLIARFGKLREAAEGSFVMKEGLHTALPDPFDRKILLSGQIQPLVVTTFLFNHEKAATEKDLASIILLSRELQPGVDGAMLTGDKNLSHGRWEAQYRIEDAVKYVKNVGETEQAVQPLLARLLETAVVREVASRTVEEVTRTAIDAVAAAVQSRLQKALDELGTGVRVDQVIAVTIEPGAVRDAFTDVSRAENEQLTAMRDAEAEAARTLNEAAGVFHKPLLEQIREYGAAQLRGADEATLARIDAAIDAQLLEAESKDGGNVSRLLQKAREEAVTASNKLRQEYTEFLGWLEQRDATPRITLLNLWVQMRQEILNSNQNEIFYVPDSNEIEILVNRNPELQQQREMEQVERRTGRRP